MLKNYLKTTFRNLKRHKAYSITNILGLAVGLSATILSDEDKRKSRFNPQTLRLSVGIEDADDLCSDLDQALAKI
ncbi:MAG: PLP-dependent transferase [Candidatus Aminicenantaceae bacterium]